MALSQRRNFDILGDEAKTPQRKNTKVKQYNTQKAYGLLVPLGYIHHCTYTDGLSTW